MNRQTNLQQLQNETFDLCIIGAGASGAGCALDAALRGMKVALIDRDDFCAETSSKSTKLIHGGVRYLEQAFKNLDLGQLKQVRHGLAERHTVIQNAPHLAHPLAILTPVNSWFEGFYFTIGLKLYGLFAKNDSLPKAQWLNRRETFEAIPTLNPKLHSAVLYYDGQLDDARYCLALAHSADEAGATVANYVAWESFGKTQNRLTSAHVRDVLTGEKFEIKAKRFLNCTGPHADHLRLDANPAIGARIRPSKGVHLVLPAEVLKSEYAMLIPKTKDGRVIFVIPFEGVVNVGTTDDEYQHLDQEPILEAQEIDFLLETLAPYLSKKVERSQIQAGFGGLRPLISMASTSRDTKALLRDHEVEHDEASGLLSLLGGKWTTYRVMAQDAIDKVTQLLEIKQDCSTSEHLLVGAAGYSKHIWQDWLISYPAVERETAQHLAHKYGSLGEKVLEVAAKEPGLFEKISPQLPYIQAEVVYQAKEEMAMLPRDVIARRWRLEIGNWKLANQIIPKVTELLGQTHGNNSEQIAKMIQDYRDTLQYFAKKSNIKID
jgi:glycerol-3-phosphate dehydrogenase